MKIYYDDVVPRKDEHVWGKNYMFYRAQALEVPDDVGLELLRRGFKKWVETAKPLNSKPVVTSTGESPRPMQVAKAAKPRTRK